MNWSYKYHSRPHNEKNRRPTREFCNVSLISIKHILLDCPSLAEERKSFLHSKEIEDILIINN